MRRSILFVDNRTEYFVSHRLLLAVAAQTAGFDVHVTTLTTGDAEPIRQAGFTYHNIAPGYRDGTISKEFILLKRLFSLYHRLKPDLLHHITLRAVLYGSLAGSILGKTPCVNGITGLGYLFTEKKVSTYAARNVLGAFFRLLLKRDRYRTTFQNVDDQTAFENNKWVKQSCSVLIPGSGVDAKYYCQLPFCDGVPVVVFASRLLRHKGAIEFINAAQSLKQAGINARFVIAGDTDRDNPAAIPLSQVQKWSDSGIIEYWGHRTDMRQVFAQSSIVCLPSYREGLPKVLLEAAACCRPIVTTDVPGCRAVVSHGENGLLVPARDSEGLAAALRQLIVDGPLRKQMGRKGREKVEREFTTDRIVAQTLAVYEELLNSFPNHVGLLTRQREL